MLSFIDPIYQYNDSETSVKPHKKLCNTNSKQNVCWNILLQPCCRDETERDIAMGWCHVSCLTVYVWFRIFCVVFCAVSTVLHAKTKQKSSFLLINPSWNKTLWIISLTLKIMNWRSLMTLTVPGSVFRYKVELLDSPVLLWQINCCQTELIMITILHHIKHKAYVLAPRICYWLEVGRWFIIQ